MLWILTGLSATAGELDLGVGLRNSLTEEGMIEGVRLIARWDVGAWSAELGGYGTWNTERISPHEKHITELINLTSELADYTPTVAVDQTTISGVFTHRFISPAPELSCGPALYLGGELRQQMLYILSYTESEGMNSSESGKRMLAGPVAGVGMEVSRKLHTSRLSLLDRVTIKDSAVSHEPTLALDILWRL